jgi:DNA-binding NtrC family response regulator
MTSLMTDKPVPGHVMTKKLLIVDDEVDFADFVLSASKTFGYEARVCNDCASARETLNEFTPDLMVLDIVMPGEDGIEFLNWFSTQSYDTKVILVTGYNPHYMEMAEKLSSLSGTRVITTLQKPVHLQDLRAAFEG